MLAIHGLWARGRGLALWAEDGDRPARSTSQARRSVRPHPFALPARRLAALHPGKPDLVTLLLPSHRMGPLDSPELIRAEPARTGATRLRKPPVLLPWAVPVVVVEPHELNDLADEVRYGASVHYLRALIEFAADLAGRGRVLPTLRQAGERGGQAMWRPVLAGPDAAVMHATVAAMPPVVRAERTGPPGTAISAGMTGQDPIELVEEALACLVDAAVRDRLGRAPAPLSLVPPRPRGGLEPPPVEESWLAALTSGDGNFDAEPTGVAALSQALAAWDEVGARPVGPARLVFRLAEKEPTDDLADAGLTQPETLWRLEFLLGSVADPSLLVPAERVWRDPAGLCRWIERPGELLLAELARASVIYPDLVEVLREARPSGVDLDLAGAHRFLADVAGRLNQAGYQVLLPSWWLSPRRRLGLAVSASSTPVERVVTAGGLTGKQLGQFDWRLAVGDDVLTEEEIAELAAAKAPLVRVRGQWVAIDPERLRRGLEFLRAAPRSAATAQELLAVVTGHANQEVPLPITSATADGWLGDLLSGAAEHTPCPVDPPATFRARLRPYQRRGLSWLAFLATLGLGACLGDDMGLGKTVQLLALEAWERDGQAGGKHPTPRKPTLLLCPTSLVGNWGREAATFAPELRVYAHQGVTRCHGERLAERLADADLVVTTYRTAARDIDELSGYQWRRVVLDEAQQVKNSLSATAKAVRRLRAEHRIALTGTPMENRLSELWSVMDFLNPGVLGTRERFRHRYAIPIERHGDSEAAKRLRQVTRPYLLRRRKTDPDIINDLPEKIEIIEDYRLTSEQASLYRAVVDDMLNRIEGADGIQRRGNVLAAMTKLKQVCNHPAQLLGDGSPIGQRSGKILRLEEVLAEILAEGDKALCFTQFAEFGQMLVPHLSARFDQEVLWLHGGTPRAARDEMVRRFQSDAGPSIFLLSLKAGGTGLTLTAANHVLHLDRWWNPAVENQATDRAFRIGQRRNVQVRKFTCAGTLEERIDQMIKQKKELADLVISDGESWLTELSTDKLRELFALNAEAVDE